MPKKHIYKGATIKSIKTKHPQWICSCGNKIELDFNPTTDKQKWLKTTCVKCGEKSVETTIQMCE